jgi:ribose/xylose/arabinose/galactoside ABC-type transport system permease subunit
MNARPLRFDWRDFAARNVVFLVLLAIVAANAVLTPNFATPRNVEITLIQIVFVALVGTGMTLVMALGGIDLSVGAVMGLISVAVVHLLPYGLSVVLPACLLIGLVIGLWNGLIVTVFAVQPLLVTLASVIWVRGLAQVISGGRKEYFQDPTMQFVGLGRVLGLPLQVVVTVVIVAIAAYLTRRSLFGRRLAAIGGNRSAARLAGLPIASTTITAYAVCSTLAALAGVFVTARVGSSDPTNFGVLIELDAIAAAVVGGTAVAGGRANVFGTVVGALLLQLVTAAMIMNNISFQYSLIAKAAIILFAVYLQGRRRA